MRLNHREIATANRIRQSDPCRTLADPPPPPVSEIAEYWPCTSTGGYVIDAGDHRWRYDARGALAVYIRYRPETYSDGSPIGWRSVWINPACNAWNGIGLDPAS